MAVKNDLVIENGEEIISAFNKIGEYVNNDIGPTFLKGVSIIVILFATVKIGVNALQIVTNPESDSSWYSILFKPVMLILFILFYSSVMSFVNLSLGLTNKIIPGDPLTELNEYLHRRADETVTNFEIVGFGTGGGPAMSKTTTLPELSTEDEKLVKNIFGNIKDDNYAKDSKKMNSNDLTQGFQILMTWFGTVIRTIMMGLRQLILTILLVGGPVAILLSFIPSMEKSAVHWFGMYIHTFMWLPVSKIIDYFILITSKALVLGNKHGMIFFLMECILVVAYFFLPKITSFFVSSKDGGGIMSAIGLAAFGAFRQVSNQVSSARQSISGVAGNIEKGVGIVERISNLRTGGSNNGDNTDKLN